MTGLLSSLHLLRPHWLWLLLPLAVLVWWIARSRQRSGTWRSVIAPELLPYLMEAQTDSRRRSLLPLLAIAWASAVIALSGPSWQKLPQPVLQKQDALVLVLDLSFSMWAQDLSPSRIDQARRKLLDLLDMRQEGQTALIAYAGDAHVVTPLTDDHPTIANLLPALDPGMMPLPGSDPVAAIDMASQLLSSAGISRGRILLVTDGVNEADVETLQDMLAGTGTSLSVLGVGTPEGAPIPLPEGGFLKSPDGDIVMPQLPVNTLRRLASGLGNRYQTLSVEPSDLEALLAPAGEELFADSREIDRSADTWADMAHWFALPLLPVLLLAFRRGLVYALLPIMFLLPSEHASAGVWRDLWLTRDQQGARALAEGNAEAAAERFADPRWRGTAAYKAGDYAAAADSFGSEDSADDWYNRGNALARQGELDAAIAAYHESLRQEPDREDAQDNLELVEALKRQQEQEQQNQDQGENQDQDPGQDQGGQQQGDDGTSSPDADQDDGGAEPEQDQSDGEPGQQEPGDDNNPGDDPGDQDNDAESSGDAQETEGDQSAAADSREQPGADIDTASSLAESLERDQAMQQWLRRVPDDPAGLLREKFRYESRKRQRKGDDRRRDEDTW